MPLSTCAIQDAVNSNLPTAKLCFTRLTVMFRTESDLHGGLSARAVRCQYDR
jgi:hypothetical protein